MKPYFDTNHVAGLLILIALLAWAVMEFAQFSRGLPGAEGGHQGQRGRLLGRRGCLR